MGKRILFAGGGTGGHIYPILAITEKIQVLAGKRGTPLEMKYFGPAGNYRQMLLKNGLDVSGIVSSKWRRYFDLRNIIDIPLFIIGLIQALWKVFWFMPDALFSKGGPGALPVVLAAKLYRVPIMVHESDSVPGLTNGISAKYASRIAISFASAADYLPEKKKEAIALIGNPIRNFLISEETINQQTAKKIFGFDPELPLILVLGGSQGSTAINDFFFDAVPELVKEFQILHQAGLKNIKSASGEFNYVAGKLGEREKTRYKIAGYFEDNLKDALTAADIVISRAGSGSIFELAALGKPSILIPLPSAANNHQVMNAYEYAKTGAAIVIEEANLKTNILMTQLKSIFGSPEKMSLMSESAKKFAKPDAAEKIAEEILELAG
jgi:UDP-N-acetylglucosamine--N-acetylmuramyl-(pentapeptide) pyrophosphoryl-undecaprenol N-acetylglucosamine transferase